MSEETPVETELKKVKGELETMQMQLGFLKQQSLGVGTTFANIVRELLLALGDPADVDQVSRAKRHAKELLKQWDAMVEQQAPTSSSNGATSSSRNTQ